MKKIILLLTIGVALTTQTLLAQVPSYVPSNGLVGYWPFSGNANDQSGNGFNGTVNGATLITDRFGNTNSAYSFDGINDFISCLPIPISGSAPRSITFWYKETGTITSGNTAFSWGAPTQGNRFDCGMSPSGAGVGAAFSAKFFSYISIPTNWNMYTIILPSITNPTVNDIKVYQNGVLLTNVITSNSINVSTPINTTANQPLNFGKNNNFTDQAHLIGNLDDIGIWNRALSQEEITAMYNGVTYSETCNAVSGSLINGLVGYWPFCGNANDQSGNNLNGIVTGATLTTDRFGNSNSAYNFNGISNKIEVNDNTQLQLTTFSVSLWVNATSGYSLVNKSNWSDGSLETFNIGLGTNLLNSSIKMNSNCFAGQGWNNITTNTGSLYNSWKHIVVVFNGSNVKHFVNGVQVNSQSLVGLMDTCFGGKLKFGAWWQSSPDYLNGKLDDIGIWNRALTQQEITQLYNQNQCITNITVTDTLIINVGQLSFENPILYANNISIFPNPASTDININFNNITNLNGGSIKIINSLGQQVATTSITTTGTNSTMSLSTWGGTGLYFVQILNPQGQIVDIKKILLQ